MTAFTFVKATSTLVCVLLIVTGLGYLWHYIPETSFTGVQPPEDFRVEGAWQKYNELTGWALLFSGFTTLVFVWIMRRFRKSIFKYIALVISSLLLSLILASLVVSLVEIFIL